MPSSITVANRLLELAHERNDTITPMQLLKLVYIAHGWNLGLYGRALIHDEVQAWKYGPVIPKLYNAIRHYKSNSIDGLLPNPKGESLWAPDNDIIEQVYNIYGQKSGVELSRLTHQPGTPWHTTYREGDFGTVIPTDLIEDHYRSLADSAV